MSQHTYIPFNKPYVSPNAIRYVEEALSSDYQQGGGPFNQKAARLVKEINGGGEVFLTSSCTQALEMATILLDLKPGDEVIIPSYTFTSAATALVNYGVIPVFVDIEPLHLNIDPNKVRAAITPKTKAISIVNYAGFACDFNALDSIAREFGLLKIEDNAHGFGTVSNGFQLGVWGDVATLSFHATKNIQCGEGGALIVNNSKFIERAFAIQEKGTNRKQFVSGAISKYQWVDKGGSFLQSEICAAVLLAQLENFDSIQSRRKTIWSRYSQNLFEFASKGYLRILNQHDLENHSAHMFAVLLSHNNRAEFQGFLKKNNIEANFHYQNLSKSSAGKIFAKTSGEQRNTEWASDNLIRLPIWHDLEMSNVDRIIDAISNFFQNRYT